MEINVLNFFIRNTFSLDPSAKVDKYEYVFLSKWPPGAMGRIHPTKGFVGGYTHGGHLATAVWSRAASIQKFVKCDGVFWTSLNALNLVKTWKK